MQKIELNHKFIQHAANTFNIDYRILSSIIYTERTLNYNWNDEIFDIYLSQLGYNSSIGFCQVKIKTAYWIENKLFTDQVFKEFSSLLPISSSKEELISKLSQDSLNILYAAAYIKIIQTIWYNCGFPISERPDIIATLYSLGLFDNSGELRQPHFLPVPNTFGKKVSDVINYF